MSNFARQKKIAIRYGDIVIYFSIRARSVNIPKISIKVHPDCSVAVYAPLIASHDEIIGAVRKRAYWIYRQQCYFERRQEYILSQRYVSGENHFYLGHRYRLKVSVDARYIPEVKLYRGVLEVRSRIIQPENIKFLLLNWYRARAREVFDRRLDVMITRTQWVQHKPPIRLLAMSTQWGRCSLRGRLTLNPHLVKAPRECIDYVLLHGLCHITEHHHSERFYRLMTQVMPHWEKVKERLNGLTYFYLNNA